MNIGDIPAWFAKRFGADATGTHLRPIPATTSDPNAASMAVGFPPNTFSAIGAGGSPMDGRDLNGILNYLSAWAQWSGVGGPAPWTQAIATGAGGYPMGAIVLSGTVAGRLYQSQTNNNTTNPDTGGAGWAILVDKAATTADMTAGTSNERVVTPALLAGGGYDRVVAQSLIANGGFRVFASGLKECWGTASVPQNNNRSVTLPTAHSAWFVLSLADSIQASGTSQDNNGWVSKTGVTSFTLGNRTGSVRLVDWSTRGV